MEASAYYESLLRQGYSPEQAKQYAEARRTVTDLLLDRLAQNRKSLDNISKSANNMLIREPLVGGIVGRRTS